MMLAKSRVAKPPRDSLRTQFSMVERVIWRSESAATYKARLGASRSRFPEAKSAVWHVPEMVSV